MRELKIVRMKGSNRIRRARARTEDRSRKIGDRMKNFK